MSANNNLRPLTPEKSLNANLLGKYREALNYALDDQDIHNIALSGSYGSGKSSILGSYENISPEKRFIHITLAHFDQPYAEVDTKGIDANEAAKQCSDDQKEKKLDDKRDRIANILEGKILNQVLHQIDPRNIPLSTFHIKAPASKKRVASVCAYGGCFTFLLLYHFYYELWSSMVKDLAPSWPTNLLIWTIKPGFRVAAAIALVILLLLGISVLLHALQRKNSLQKIFKRIDVKGTVGIEMFEDGDESCFDKYLNEVLYLFEHSGADAIVFEDLDRYDVVQIFEKLRVISDLLQQRKERGISQSDKDYPIPKFIYLIRDSIFSPGERTKFFDLIIPVVPVVAFDNAYDKILERVGENKFSNKLLRNISTYVGDMRLINNIINEYMIYDSQIGSSKLDRNPNLMLSMMVYKNLFPEDFELLRHRRGYVAWVVSQKDKLIARQIEKIDKEIKELQHRIDVSQEEFLEDIDELNALFFPYNGIVEEIDGTPVKDSTPRVTLVRAFLNAEKVRVYEYPGSRRTLTTTEIDSLRQEMEGDLTYQKKREVILDEQEERRKEILASITDLKGQRGKIAIYSLGELLAAEAQEFWRPSINAMRSMSIRAEMLSCPEFPLLQYLLQNSYIDENYAVYISYFYPNSLVPEDKNYLLAVHSHRTLGCDYILHDPAAVLELIEPAYFADKNMWNLSLFDHLVSLGDQTDEQKKCITAWFEGTERAANLGEDGYTFILRLWEGTQQKDLLVPLINKYEPDWFRRWTLKGFLKDDEWRLYTAYTLTTVNGPKMLEPINKDHWLTNAIATDNRFLMTPFPSQSQLHKMLFACSVRLASLECCIENQSLAESLYRDGMYQLTPDVLTYLLTTRYGADQDTALEKSYSYLLQKPEEPLSFFVEEHLDEYVDALVSNGSRLSDSEEAVIKLLNQNKLDIDHKKKYLALSDTTMSLLESVKDRLLWRDLLELGRMEMHWENVADYYCYVGQSNVPLPDTLVGYIEQGKGCMKCKFSEIIQRIGKDKANALLHDLMKCTRLSISSYRGVWNSIYSVYYNNLQVNDLPDENIQVLISAGKISMTGSNVSLMRASYPDHLTSFILSKVSSYIELAEEGNITLERNELSSLFCTRKIPIRQEEKLLKLYIGTIPAAGKNYHPKLMLKIIAEHFDKEDAEWFLLNYTSLDRQIANAFINWGKSDIVPLMKAVDQVRKIPEDVYAACLDTFTLAQAQRLRQYLPNKGYNRVCTRTASPRFADKESSRSILTYFQKQGWISSWKALPNGQLKAFSKRTK